MTKIGMMILMVGIAAADSPSLLIPLALVIIGMVMVWKGEQEND